MRPRAANYVYGATKSGMDTFFRGLGGSRLHRSVRVVVVRPGFVHTRMTRGLAPAPLATTPDRVARAVVDGVRRGSTVVYAPAGLRPVMAVLTHLPRCVFDRLPS